MVVVVVGGGGASLVVGVSVGSGNVGRTRCPRPSCRALALPLTPSSPPPPPVWPRPSCVAPPAPWCLTPRREGLHGVWAVSLCCCKWTKVVFGEEPPKIQPHLSSPPPPPPLLHRLPHPLHGASYFVSEGDDFGVSCWCVRSVYDFYPALDTGKCCRHRAARRCMASLLH